MEMKHLLSSQNFLGEGPLWHAEEQTLYWVDITGRTINRYQPETGKHEIFPVDSEVGVVAFRGIGGFITAGSRGFGFWKIRQNQLSYFQDPEAGRPESRFNDGKVDRKGRFWAGTMTPQGAVSALYRLDADLSIHTIEKGLTISNGIGWSPDNTRMYLVDSLRFVIYEYNYDFDSGDISNRRVFVQLSEDYGIPDGLTVDREGFVWCAIYGGSKITRFNPQGTIVAEIGLPVSQPTSCIFGGMAYHHLYVTTARDGLSEEELKLQPQAGDLFEIETDVQGLPEPSFAG